MLIVEIDRSELVRRRKATGLTQKEFARRAGVSQNLLAKLEAGIKANCHPEKGAAIIRTIESLEAARAAKGGQS